MNITVWNEYRHEKENPIVSSIYPGGIHDVIAKSLRDNGFGNVTTATLDEPEHGLSSRVLEQTDVLLWWGHKAHSEVHNDIVHKVRERVLAGMGLIALHSAHHSKIFRTLMGTSCSLRWRESNEKEVVWVVKPGHPVAAGLGASFVLEKTEMYGEFFDVPVPDELIFISSFEGGEVFRSGCCFYRGHGKIFYFRPGHETLPIYHDPNVRRVIANAVRWAGPTPGSAYQYGGGSAIHAV